MRQQNPDLLAVSATLNAIATSIHSRKDETEDPDLYKALNTELVEINHRITMIGGLIFRQRTKAITAAAERVGESREAVAAAIESIDKLNAFIKTVSGFLGLIDKVIDLAKAATPA